MISAYLNLPRRELQDLHRSYLEQAKRHMATAAHASKTTMPYWEERATEALQKAAAVRRVMRERAGQ